MILQQKRKKKKRNCSAISTTGNIIAGAMPSLSPEPKGGEAGNVRKQIHTDPIVVPVAKGLVDLGIQGVSLKGKTQNKSGKQKKERKQKDANYRDGNDVLPWITDHPQSTDISVNTSKNISMFSVDLPISMSMEKMPAIERDLQVTISLGQGNSYNVRVSTCDTDAFDKSAVRKAKTTNVELRQEFSKLFCESHSEPSLPPMSPINNEGRDSPSRMSFRDKIASRKISTRGSTDRSYSRGSPSRAYSRGSASRANSRASYRYGSSRGSRASSRPVPDELRILKSMNRLTSLLRSKQEVRRELLLSQQEFREMFDLREKIATPLPPIEKPIYNCDIPTFLSPSSHPSHPYFTLFKPNFTDDPIKSTAAELSHARLDSYYWVRNDKDGQMAAEQDIDDNHFREYDIEKEMQSLSPQTIQSKRKKRFYYPAYFQDSVDLAELKRGELADLSVSSHLELDTSMTELKIILDDIKKRKIKRQPKLKYKSDRNTWMKKR